MMSYNLNWLTKREPLLCDDFGAEINLDQLEKTDGSQKGLQLGFVKGMQLLCDDVDAVISLD